MSKNAPVWIVGVGPLSVEYWKILMRLDHPVTAIGRGAELALQYADATSEAPHQGGLQFFRSDASRLCPNLPLWPRAWRHWRRQPCNCSNMAFAVS